MTGGYTSHYTNEDSCPLTTTQTHYNPTHQLHTTQHTNTTQHTTHHNTHAHTNHTHTNHTNHTNHALRKPSRNFHTLHARFSHTNIQTTPHNAALATRLETTPIYPHPNADRTTNQLRACPAPSAVQLDWTRERAPAACCGGVHAAETLPATRRRSEGAEEARRARVRARRGRPTDPPPDNRSRANEQTSKRANEQTSKRANEQTSKRAKRQRSGQSVGCGETSTKKSVVRSSESVHHASMRARGE